MRWISKKALDKEIVELSGRVLGQSDELAKLRAIVVLLAEKKDLAALKAEVELLKSQREDDQKLYPRYESPLSFLNIMCKTPDTTTRDAVFMLLSHLGLEIKTERERVVLVKKGGKKGGKR